MQSRKIRKGILLALAGFVLLIYANNTSLLHSPIAAQPLLLAHRGLGQDFTREGLTGDTCTASRILPPEHNYLEDTIPGIEAAFAYGAGIVEFDVHPTVDGEFVVFHDWTLECRTDGAGVTREQTLAYLKTLDVGYGYTADGGKTFPFRGQGVGLMPSLDEVFTAFPDRSFLINIKSSDPYEGALLAEELRWLPPAQQSRLMVFGAEPPIAVVRRNLPNLRAMSRKTLERCLIRYLALGWSGYVPHSCEHTLLLAPANVAPWLWGWPNRFLQRMDAAGTLVFLVDDYTGGRFSNGLNNIDDLEKVPLGYSGGIWTDRVDIISAGLANRADAAAP